MRLWQCVCYVKGNCDRLGENIFRFPDNKVMFEKLTRNGNKTKYFLFIGIVCAAILLYLLYCGLSKPNSRLNSSSTWWLPSKTWVPYSYRKFREKSWFYKTCVPSIRSTVLEELPDLLLVWKYTKLSECRKLYVTFTNIITVISQNAEVTIPKSFESKVKGWLGNDDEVFKEAHNQSVIFTFNEYTREQNTYNPIRNKRPMSVPDQPEREYVDSLSKETEDHCDFCKYDKYTAMDKFGHIQGEFSYSAGNTFKLDRWHALFMLRNHHPLNWRKKEFLDLMETAQRWYRKVYSQYNVFRYPALVWDLLPHAGASQVHPHLHGFLDSKRYQGAMENVRLAAEAYQRDFPGQNYFTDWIEIHSVLGLTVEYGTAVAVASLVPKKDNEVVIISAKADNDFFQLMYFVIRAFIDDMENLCFSSGIAFPSMTGEMGSDSLPVFMRIVSRGAVAEIRSDISSLELFLSPNANTDPFKVIKYIKESVRKRSGSPR